jgi:hypothetical protein
VHSGPLPERFEIWLDTWRLEGLDLSGSYRQSVAKLRLDAGVLTLASSRRPAIVAEVRASGASDQDRPVALESFELTAAGLVLTARGRGAMGDAATFEGELDLDADLGRLFPDLTASGGLHAAGDLGFGERGFRGSGRLRVRDLPAALIGPWAEEVVAGELDLRDSRIEADAELDWLGEALNGSSHFIWRRGEERLLDASLRTLEITPGSEGPPVQLVLEAEALPGWPGRRSLSGQLVAPAWEELERAELRQGKLEIQVDDLAAAGERFGLEPGVIRRWGLNGVLTTELEAEGPIFAPRLVGQLNWRDARSRILTLGVRSLGALDLGRELKTGLAFEAVLLPDDPGRRGLSGTLQVSDLRNPVTSELMDGVALLDLPDLPHLYSELAQRWPALADWLPDQARFLAGSLTVDLRASGPLSDPELTVEAAWQPGGREAWTLEARGRPRARQPFYSGAASARLHLEEIDLSRFELEDDKGRRLAGLLGGRLRFDGDGAGFVADAQLRGRNLGYEGGFSAHRLEVEARTDGHEVEVISLLLDPAEGPLKGRLTGQASFELARPVQAAQARLQLLQPLEGIDQATAELRLAGGTLYFDSLGLLLRSTEAGVEKIELEAAIPLAALRSFPELEEILTELPIEADTGLLTIRSSRIEVELLTRFLGIDTGSR